MNIREKLLNTQIVEEDEFLDKYVQLIENNRTLVQIKKKTQRHHIIPVCYYTSMNSSVDNSKENLVNLYYKDHVLAHYYLALCSKGKFKYQNLEPIFIIMGHKNFPSSEQNMLERLPEIQRLYEEVKSLGFNAMNDPDVKMKHDSIMRSEEVRTAISNTMKQKVSDGILFDNKHRKNLSEAAKGNQALKGYKKIYKCGYPNKFVPECDVDKYLQDGWTTQYTGKRKYKRHIDPDVLHSKLSKVHLGKSPSNKGIPCSTETKKKLSQYFSGTNWMHNDIEQHQVPKELQKEFLEKGYKYGMLRK